MFDSVRNEIQRQDRFYQCEIKATVRQFVGGDNGCVLFFGPSGSGKSFTMQGKTGTQRGVMPRAVEEVLTLIGNDPSSDYDMEGFLKTRESDYDGVDKLYLRAAMYMIHCDNAYDLLSRGSAQQTRRVKVECFIDQQTKDVVSQMVGLTEKVITNLEQYYGMMQQGFKERRIMSSRLADHDIRKRSHLVVQFTLCKKNSDALEDFAKLNFVELAGSEQSVPNSDTLRDTSVRQFVTRSFNCLSTQILKVAANKKQGSGNNEEGESTLINCLKSTLTSRTNITLVNCCSPNSSQFPHTLPAIKFCAKIRDTIVRRVTRKNVEKKGEKSTTNTLIRESQVDDVTDYINSLRFEIQAISQKLRLGDKNQSIKSTQNWCSQNLQIINQALHDYQKSERKEVVEDLEYYKQRIKELEVNYLNKSEQRMIVKEDNFNADRDNIFNQVMRPKEHVTKTPSKIEHKFSQRRNEAYDENAFEPVTDRLTQRSKKSDQTHQRIQSDIVALPAHLKSLIEYKSTLKLSEMQDKFMSSQQIKDLIGGVNKPQGQLYETTDQTLQDIQRLIMLEDFAGLKRRVVALSKERLQCNEVIDCQSIEIEELRMQLDARFELVEGVKRLNEDNLKECSQNLKEWEQQQLHKQEEIEKHIGQLEFTLVNTTSKFDELNKRKNEIDIKLITALSDVEDHKKERTIAETRLKEVQDQNDKIMLNYEVLKEHELNIIKDCSNKQKESKTILSAKLTKLEVVIDSKDQSIAMLHQQMRDQDDLIRAFKFEVSKFMDREKIGADQQNILECKIERQQREIDERSNYIDKLTHEIKVKDDHILEAAVEKRGAMLEITELQNLVTGLEKQCAKLHADINERDNRLLLLHDAQREISEAKSVADECIRLKNKELESAEARKTMALEELKKSQDDYRQLEKANIRIKAHEYDKVDVMRKNVELDSTIKSLRQELEDVVGERNKAKKIGETKSEENHQVCDQNKKLLKEIEMMRRTHEQTLNNFDQKFSEFSNELQILTNQNTQMKETEKTFKRRTHIMELENVEWREKCKYLEIRHYDKAERCDVRSILEVPRLPKVIMNEIKQELAEQEDAFGDIKSLINNFKKEREAQKESKQFVANLASSQRRMQLKPGESSD